MSDSRPAVRAEALLRWFQGRERKVPGRGESDPYRIWVAEVMAQQTRLSTVREYYGPFLERFPDVRALAAADLDAVLRAWEGLGYYARARNLHAAARRVAGEWGGSFPEDPSRLRELPGVGPYTAGAVASLAFGRPVPAVDGNARRVLCRLHDLADPPRRELEDRAASLLSARPGRAAGLNQALMDLGAEICTPSDPACDRCPVAEGCLARERGTVELRPLPSGRPAAPHRDVGVGVVWRAGRLLVARRPPEGLLGGLWEFPGGKVEEGESAEAAVRRELREEMAIEVEVGRPLARVEHAYSHLRVTLHAFHARWVRGEPRARAATEWRWTDPEDLDELAFPVANRRIIDALRSGEPPAFASG